MFLGLLGGLAFTAVFWYRANEAAVERRNQSARPDPDAAVPSGLVVRRREGVSTAPGQEDGDGE
jgi:hypothetical protein